MRVFKRVTHAGLRRQIDDALRPVFFEHPFNLVAVGKIGLYEMKIVLSLQPRQTSKLEIDVIIIVEVIEADDVITTGKQGPCGLRADETGDARYQHLHAANLPIRGANPATPSFQNSQPGVACLDRQHLLEVVEDTAGNK